MNYLVLLNGLPPDKPLCQKLAADADSVICVDGALNYAYEYGIRPDIMLGDMDSADPNFLNKLAPDTTIIRHNPIKDETDFELAINYASENGASKLTVLGFSGGRIDQSIANIMLFIRAWRMGIAIDARDGNQRLFICEGPVAVSARKGDTFSVFPLTEGVRISLKSGLFYPLDKYELKTDQPIGVSNVMTADKADIESDGPVLVIITEAANA